MSLVGLFTAVAALQLPSSRGLPSAVVRPALVSSAAIAWQAPAAVSAAMPTLDRDSGIIQKLFVRDGVDAYYAVILIGFGGYYLFNFVVAQLDKAKAMDVENAKAKKDGRSDLTAAFKKAAKDKQ